MKIKETIIELYEINFKFDEWYEKNKQMEKSKILEKIDKYEKLSHALAGMGVTILASASYLIGIYGRDKVAHLLKGYLASTLANYAYRHFSPNKKRGKLIGILTSIVEGMGYEVFQYFTQSGSPEILDASSDVLGGFLSYIISRHWDKRREIVESSNF